MGDSAELVEILSRDILSVHWVRAATHCDGAGLEKGYDVSIFKEHLRFFENRENPRHEQSQALPRLAERVFYQVRCGV